MVAFGFVYSYITPQQSSVKFDLTSQPLPDLDTVEDAALDFSQSLSIVSNSIKDIKYQSNDFITQVEICMRMIANFAGRFCEHIISAIGYDNMDEKCYIFLLLSDVYTLWTVTTRYHLTLCFFELLLLIVPLDMKETLNETEEGPTLWTVTALNREQLLDRSETKLKAPRRKEMRPSLKLNLTLVNTTFNYTMTEEVSVL